MRYINGYHTFPRMKSLYIRRNLISTFGVRNLPSSTYTADAAAISSFPKNAAKTECRRSVRSSSSSSSSSIPFYGSPRPPSARYTASLDRNDSIPPLGPLQRIGVFLHSSLTAVSNPGRADAVAGLGEVTGHFALSGMRSRMASDPTGRRILTERPVVSSATIGGRGVAALGECGDGTFGRAYAEFMDGHDFNPDDRDAVRFVSDPELAYVMTRYRQCHDFWHVLTGLPPTVLGELGLKWLELVQTGLPVAALSATVGSVRLGIEEREILSKVYLPWAIRVGRKAQPLMNVYYEEEFSTNLGVLRDRLGIEPAPSVLT